MKTDARIYIAGYRGFIRFHLARRLLEEDQAAHGYDGLTNYYDVRLKQPSHLLMASTSSVYGAKDTLPFDEQQKTDWPLLTLYVATKKANKAMSHAWAHIHGVPTTMCRVVRQRRRPQPCRAMASGQHRQLGQRAPAGLCRSHRG